MPADGPAQFDSQFNGEGEPTHWLWVEALEEHREIAGTEVISPSVTRLVLDDATGIQEGMLVALRTGPDGTRMWELDHPDFAREPDGRRVVRTWREEFARGERNYLWPRSFFDFWLGNNGGAVYVGLWAESASWQISPVGGVDVTGLPPGQFIPAGSWVHDGRGDTQGGVTTWHMTQTDVTVDGGGNATLLLIETPVVEDHTVTTSADPPFDQFLLYVPPPKPPGFFFGPWSELTPGAGELRRPYQWRDKSFGGPLRGMSIVGAQGFPEITVTGLPIPGPFLIERIQPGDIVDVQVPDVGHFYFQVAGHTDVDGSGQAVIPVRGFPTNFLASLGAPFPITIIRPGPWDEPGDNAVVLPSMQRFNAEPYSPTQTIGAGAYDGAMGGARIVTPFRVQRDAAVPSVWGHVGYTLVGSVLPSRISSQAPPSVEGSAQNYRPPALSIISATNLSEAVATALDVDRTIGQGETVDIVLRVQHHMTDDEQMWLAFNGPVMEPEGRGWDGPTTIVRWMMLTIGSDSGVPPFAAASLANLLHERGNRALNSMVLGERFIRLRIRDAAALPGFMSSDELLVLGADVRIVVPGFVDTTVRVVSITYDLVDPANTEIVVDALPPRLLPILPPGVRR